MIAINLKACNYYKLYNGKAAEVGDNINNSYHDHCDRLSLKYYKIPAPVLSILPMTYCSIIEYV